MVHATMDGQPPVKAPIFVIRALKSRISHLEHATGLWIDVRILAELHKQRSDPAPQPSQIGNIRPAQQKIRLPVQQLRQLARRLVVKLLITL